MNDSTTQLPHIKNGAIITLNIGTLMIGHIQGALMHLTKDLTTEQMATLKGKVEQKGTLTDQESLIVTISTLLMAITKEAESTGQVEYRDIQSTFGI